MDPPGLPTNETGTSTNPNPVAANPPLGPQQPPNYEIILDQLGQFMNTVNQALNQLAIRIEELLTERSPPGYGRAPPNQGQVNYEQAHPGQGGNPNVPIGQPGLQNPDPQVPLNQRVPPPPPNPPAPRQLIAPPPDSVAAWLHAQPPPSQNQGHNADRNVLYREISFAPPNYAAMSSIRHINPAQRYNRQQQRHFSRLPGSLSQIFEHLKAAGLLHPKNPRSPQDPPLGGNANAVCHYHQAQGHDTNICQELRHAIQDLIDNETIPNPEVPNVANNSLPNYGIRPLRKRRQIQRT